MSDPAPTLSEGQAQPRVFNKPEAPYDWISRIARQRILNRLGNTDAAFGLGVYFAVIDVSADKNCNPFDAKINEIAGRARLSYPKTLAILNLLEGAGVIAIERHERVKGCGKDQAPHTYTIVSFRRNGVKSDRRNTVKSDRLNKTMPPGECHTRSGVSPSPEDTKEANASLDKEKEIVSRDKPTAGTKGPRGNPAQNREALFNRE